MNTKRITTLKNWKWRDWFGSVEWSLELNLDIGVNSIIMNNGWLIMVYWVQANVILWLIKCVMNTWLDWMDILKWWRRDTRRIQWDPKSPDWFTALEVQWIILHTICWEVLSLYVKNGIDSHFESFCFDCWYSMKNRKDLQLNMSETQVMSTNSKNLLTNIIIVQEMEWDSLLLSIIDWSWYYDESSFSYILHSFSFQFIDSLEEE